MRLQGPDDAQGSHMCNKCPEKEKIKPGDKCRIRPRVNLIWGYPIKMVKNFIYLKIRISLVVYREIRTLLVNYFLEHIGDR